jgi:hypothetical protein
MNTVEEMFAYGSFRNWLRLLWANQGSIERRFIRRLAGALCTSALTAPLRIYERICYHRRLEQTSIDEYPIFIIGHFRSGTTFLQGLLAQDRHYGYISKLQTYAPELCLIGQTSAIKSIIARSIPMARSGDNVSLSLDSPHEEEYAIAGMSPYSFYHQWSFPRNARTYFEKYVLFQGISPSVVTRWKQIYLAIFRKATLLSGGKPLIIKNPLNTARIPVLLELFPKAKFIHIHRNPYVVFLSMRKMYESFISGTQFHTITPAEIEKNILIFYQGLMQKYIADKSLIGSENFVEIRYEDLERDPLEQLRQIYDTLRLSHFTELENVFQQYLHSMKGYQKNHYDLTPENINMVKENWSFALDKWGY